MGDQLAVIGLGNMGAGVALRLLQAGYGVRVHNRTAAKAAPVVEAGATLAESLADAVSGVTTIVLSLADEAAVEDVLFRQLSKPLVDGVTVIDTSTVSPAYAREAARRLAEIGVRRVEATVVGNPRQARDGTLRVFTAGPAPLPEQAAEVLAALGTQVVHVGDTGSAATLKLVFNLVLGAQVAGLAEAVAFGVDAGLDRDMMLGAIADSGFSSMVMRFRAELMRRRAYQPAFFRARLMAKDIKLALPENHESDVDFPVLASVLRSFVGVIEAGAGDDDASVLLEHVVARRSGGEG